MAYNKEWVEKNREHIRGYREKTKEQRNARRRELYAQDEERRLAAREKANEYRRNNPNKRKNNDLKKTFGITLDDYNRILEFQGGGCAICGRTDSGDSQSKYLYVDHCHDTGIVRGLLCSGCNLALGKFRDNPELLRKAADYVMLGGIPWTNG